MRNLSILGVTTCTMFVMSRNSATAFVVISQSSTRKVSSSSFFGSSSSDSFDLDVLERRLEALKIHNLELEYRRPPNKDLNVIEFVQECVEALQNNNDPVPDAGFRVLMRSSTASWKRQLYRSVGAPGNANPDVVASSLGQAMGRPDNQFAIVVGESDESFIIDFPSDPVEYSDEAWVECQLRNADTNELFVITGWSLEKVNGAWMVNRIDWQDFRDQFRPGIGREEWMRICG